METPQTLLDYWEHEVGAKRWYASDGVLDAAIRDRFLALWQEARGGALEDWRATPEGALALVILLDQFPRNMFREGAESLDTDAQAREVARSAIGAGQDASIAPPLKQFFYLPFMHSEELADQDYAIALFSTRLPGDNLRHARAHRAVIARFGHFPWRNRALGRETGRDEERFLAEGGYGKALQEVSD